MGMVAHLRLELPQALRQLVPSARGAGGQDFRTRVGEQVPHGGGVES